jgi:hypothetical protein
VFGNVSVVIDADAFGRRYQSNEVTVPVTTSPPMTVPPYEQGESQGEAEGPDGRGWNWMLEVRAELALNLTLDSSSTNRRSRFDHVVLDHII